MPPRHNKKPKTASTAVLAHAASSTSPTTTPSFSSKNQGHANEYESSESPARRKSPNVPHVEKSRCSNRDLPASVESFSPRKKAPKKKKKKKPHCDPPRSIQPQEFNAKLRKNIDEIKETRTEKLSPDLEKECDEYKTEDDAEYDPTYTEEDAEVDELLH